MLASTSDDTRGEDPSPLEMLGCPIIEEWSTSIRHRGKEFVIVVEGLARQHTDYADGDMIATSAVMWFDHKLRFIRTTRRVYALGKPSGDEIPIDGVDL
jgi:hypothetical protein